jgi:hypothetical protein
MALADFKSRCLYYPYSRAINTDTLKKAVLLFDEIVFLDSQPWFVRSELLGDRGKEVSAQLAENYEYLAKKEIITLRDPTLLIQDHDLLLTANVVNDVHNDDFCKEAIDYDVTVWDVLTERIPPSFLKAFYPGAGTFSEAITLQALVKAKGKVEELPDNLRRFAEFRWRGMTPENLWQTFSGRYKFVIGGNPHMRLESYEIPFLQASSLRINEALLIAGMEGLTPFTDSKIHDRLLRLKVKNSLRVLVENPELREKLEIDIPLKLPRQHLAVAILDRLLPAEELEKRSLQELTEYRISHADEFARFSGKVAELATAIESIEPSSNYNIALQRMVDAKVIPEITAARDQLITDYEKSFGALALKSAKIVVPTVVVTAFAGLGVWEILGACALAELGVLSAKGADDLLEAWRARRQSERKSFAYLAEL